MAKWAFPGGGTVYDDASPVTGPDGTRYPPDWPKNEIPGLQLVPETFPEAISRISARIQTIVDSVAQSRGYHDGFAMATYVSSTVEHWRIEAQAFVLWRDIVWQRAFEHMEAAAGDVAALPDDATIDALIPAFV